MKKPAPREKHEQESDDTEITKQPKTAH